MNILSSDYFKELYRLKTYHEVIDEIYNQVDHVEPWMTGNCRGPSTAFCLLYKFFTMKLTVKQMHGLLKHPDSPYIRADRLAIAIDSTTEQIVGQRKPDSVITFEGWTGCCINVFSSLMSGALLLVGRLSTYNRGREVCAKWTHEGL
ncbi:Pre-mRNA splicing factor SR-like 1 [Vitis vinifera]|uniref:Pre-mRNA-splicing factor 38 n=1 Tax=Vitis vinifera TaxID=29760 RepID=A0A438EIQ2_VITVI|nr:Pre-mRNA splicing factor SR-like 1 [Vitis vinifera]RVX11348.1 Pre-mRNA splicing factor SR-like 1 [Vitis vinifera]